MLDSGHIPEGQKFYNIFGGDARPRACGVLNFKYHSKKVEDRMTSNAIKAAVIAVGLGLILQGAVAAAQDQTPLPQAEGETTPQASETQDQATSQALESENFAEYGEISGADEYNRLCAACHGEDGRGDGPVAGVLKTPPTNLTLLAKNNGGHFPAMRALDYIDGRTGTDAHGTREMPVWGESLTIDYDQYIARTIELELLIYLDSIQVE
jgi:cytochrome c5